MRKESSICFIRGKSGTPAVTVTDSPVSIFQSLRDVKNHVWKCIGALNISLNAVLGEKWITLTVEVASDARMSTTYLAFQLSICTCDDGWYNNDDDTVRIACPHDSCQNDFPPLFLGRHLIGK